MRRSVKRYGIGIGANPKSVPRGESGCLDFYADAATVSTADSDNIFLSSSPCTISFCERR